MKLEEVTGGGIVSQEEQDMQTKQLALASTALTTPTLAIDLTWYVFCGYNIYTGPSKSLWPDREINFDMPGIDFEEPVAAETGPYIVFFDLFQQPNHKGDRRFSEAKRNQWSSMTYLCKAEHYGATSW